MYFKLLVFHASPGFLLLSGRCFFCLCLPQCGKVLAMSKPGFGKIVSMKWSRLCSDFFQMASETLTVFTNHQLGNAVLTKTACTRALRIVEADWNHLVFCHSE